MTEHAIRSGPPLSTKIRALPQSHDGLRGTLHRRHGYGVARRPWPPQRMQAEWHAAQRHRPASAWLTSASQSVLVRAMASTANSARRAYRARQRCVAAWRAAMRRRSSSTVWHRTEWMASFTVAAPCFAYRRSPCCSTSLSRSDCHSSGAIVWESATVTLVRDDLHSL